MELQITHDVFTDEQEAMAMAEAAGLHPVAVDFEAATGDEHWHDFAAATYIVAGELDITVSSTGETCTLKPGSVITAPARLLHRERSDGFRAVVGLPCDPSEIERPVTRWPADLPVPG